MKWSRLAASLALTCVLFIFNLTLSARAQTVQFLAHFNGGDGSYPDGLVQATDGNFYGPAFGGSNFNQAGEIFRMTPSGQISPLLNLSPAEGYDPYIAVLGSDGSLYAINIYGGASIQGIFYRVTLGGEFTLLHQFCSFANCADGKNPNGLFLGFDGNFYGTTAYGGRTNQGVFFQISPTGQFKVLHSFCALPNCKDGSFPVAPIQGRDGNFYGTTVSGVIYRLTPEGSYTVLHNLCSPGACVTGPVNPSLVQDADGNLFGMTYAGGTYFSGAVFELTTGNEFKILHSFLPGVDGGNSDAGLIQANDGNFYGVNLEGNHGDGTIFEITPQGEFTLLYTFFGGNAPFAPLFQGTDGLLYGTTQPYTGGGYGTVFALSNNLSPLAETVPTGGKVGQSILILGNNLTGATSVTFNGVAAAFTVESDTYIKATVPIGATTGTVSVATPSGMLNSNPQFVVTK